MLDQYATDLLTPREARQEPHDHDVDDEETGEDEQEALLWGFEPPKGPFVTGSELERVSS